MHSSSGISVALNTQVSESPGRHSILSSSKICPGSHEKSTRPPIRQTKKSWQLPSRRDTLKISSMQSISWVKVGVKANAINAKAISEKI